MIIYLIITGLGLVLFAIAGVFLWQLIRGGQLDDLDTPPIRMLNDDHTILRESSPDAAHDRASASEDRA